MAGRDGGSRGIHLPDHPVDHQPDLPGRAERAKAIGAWGAATGVAVALGPIAGGELLAHFWWGSMFLAMVPVAALTVVGALALVPADRNPGASPLDLRGLTLSALALTSLGYTIIEAPDNGWSSGRTLAGFAIAAATFAVLAVVEYRQDHPMLDVRLFTTSASPPRAERPHWRSSPSPGFVFLIILYFQIMRGYSPLEAGVRELPVAVANSGFLDGLHVGCAVAAGVCALGALLVAAYLPAHPAALHLAGAAEEDTGGGSQPAVAAPAALFLPPRPGPLLPGRSG